MACIMLSSIQMMQSLRACYETLTYHATAQLLRAPLKQEDGCSSDHYTAATHSASESIKSSWG